MSNYFVYDQNKRANQSNSPSKIRQLINAELRTYDRNCSNYFTENKKNFGCLMKLETL